ncbi:MAG TPA: CcmD family protein [Bacteroidota bacterium]|jgi:CcmD family protein|nr:CcmD family protein [Bacteroidota bacterium]
MYDFLSGHALYIVLTIVLICWFGIFFYLYTLDRKISRIEKQLGNMS